jgi:hypothetical protein
MIKKIILTAFALGFAFLILGVSILKTSFEAFAQTDSSQDSTPGEEIVLTEEATIEGEEITEAEESTQAAEATTAAQKESTDYHLAYPGILPDHPFYFLKMIRDRIWLLLTTDCLKKAEVLLLFADKRIGAAQALVDGQKTKLGVTTATKAEKYLERAVDQEVKAREKGEDTRSFLEKITKAALKHEEILLAIREKAGGETEVIDSILPYPRNAYQTASQRLEE